MPTYTDQLYGIIELRQTPLRIISLVPSQTELLYDLGLRDEVVGITKFCIHPNEWYRSKTCIGGTKTIDFEKIKALNPDLIIGNKEENEQEQIETLMKHYTVWMSDINNLKDGLEMITNVGTLVGKQTQAVNLKLQIEQQFNSFEQLTTNASASSATINQQLTTAYFIWRNPYMVAGHSTFINDMLMRCGLNNVFGNHASRYPTVTEEEIKQANPQVIFLSSEPYPFKEKHIEELKAICPFAKILIVDGELFSWYGSRLLKSCEYFGSIISHILE